MNKILGLFKKVKEQLRNLKTKALSWKPKDVPKSRGPLPIDTKPIKKKIKKKLRIKASTGKKKKSTKKAKVSKKRK